MGFTDPVPDYMLKERQGCKVSIYYGLDYNY